MLSNRERQYLQNPKKFVKVFSEAYAKKIRTSIRRKLVQTAIDVYYLDKFEEEYWKPDEKEKSHKENMNLYMFLSALRSLQIYRETSEKHKASKRKWINSFFHLVWIMFRRKNYKSVLKMNKKDYDQMMKHVEEAIKEGEEYDKKLEKMSKEDIIKKLKKH